MKKIGLIVVLFSIITACDLEDPDVGVSLRNVVTLTLADTQIIADGNDRTSITATLGIESAAGEMITFKTDQGTFAGTSDEQEVGITAAGRTVEVFLISDLIVNQNVTVTAEVGDFKTSETIEFTRSIPTDILLEADKLIFKADQSDQVTLTTKIFKDGVGDPSEETRVDFTSMVVEGNPDVEFPPFGFSENGKIQINVKSRNTETGKIMFSATLKDDPRVAESITIELSN
ncbi:hypothetical protein QQ008_14120 [Fulvivirgaceae bacterium BMA10]|uniref:Lipoprotein n=1 Tax=Splendidivirga corallicola TaxID=3051826 RepID=A0ABT8KP62_9BACT|nr:hypothetical protein [Fulvivirgaceae bacterium BMA10]